MLFSISSSLIVCLATLLSLRWVRRHGVIPHHQQPAWPVNASFTWLIKIPIIMASVLLLVLFINSQVSAPWTLESLLLGMALLSVGSMGLWIFGTHITADEHGVSCTRLGRKHQHIGWQVLLDVTPSPDGRHYLLRADGSIITLSALMDGYADVLAIISKYRPDLLPKTR